MPPACAIRRVLFVCGAVLLGIAGCRTYGDDGPVSRQVAASRQLSQEAVTALQRGEWRQAQALSEEAVAVCPTDAEARRHLAEALWQQGDAQAALLHLEESRRLAPDQVAALVRAGEIYLAQGQPHLAYARAEEAIDVAPRSADAWRLRGEVNHRAGRYDEALADYLRALGHQPREPRTMLLAVHVHLDTRQPERALPLLHELLDSRDAAANPAHLFDLQGQALAELGRYDDAADSFALAVQHEPPSADLLARLAEAELAVGRAASAGRHLRRALALDARHPRGLELLEQLETAHDTAHDRAHDMPRDTAQRDRDPLR